MVDGQAAYMIITKDCGLCYLSGYSVFSKMPYYGIVHQYSSKGIVAKFKITSYKGSPC
jgi:hypothetical protein